MTSTATSTYYTHYTLYIQGITISGGEAGIGPRFDDHGRSL